MRITPNRSDRITNKAKHRRDGQLPDPRRAAKAMASLDADLEGLHDLSELGCGVKDSGPARAEVAKVASKPTRSSASRPAEESITIGDILRAQFKEGTSAEGFFGAGRLASK